MKTPGWIIKDWWATFCRAHSVKLNGAVIVACIFMALDTTCGVVCGYLPISLLWISLITCFLSVAAFLSRFVYQPSLHNAAK
jgi:hypothetical protein